MTSITDSSVLATPEYRQFIEDLKASGFVAEGLKRSNQPDATVAPAA